MTSLLQAGANVNTINKVDTGSLADASTHGWLDIIDELIKHGAYIGTGDIMGDMRRSAGQRSTQNSVPLKGF